MKLLHISDTHGLHKQLINLSQADAIVHSGNFTEHGTDKDVLITHTPPLGIFDFVGGIHFGEFDLFQKVSDNAYFKIHTVL